MITKQHQIYNNMILFIPIFDIPVLICVSFTIEWYIVQQDRYKLQSNVVNSKLMARKFELFDLFKDNTQSSEILETGGKVRRIDELELKKSESTEFECIYFMLDHRESGSLQNGFLDNPNVVPIYLCTLRKRNSTQYMYACYSIMLYAYIRHHTRRLVCRNSWVKDVLTPFGRLVNVVCNVIIIIIVYHKQKCRVGSDRTRFRIRTQSLHCLSTNDRYT